jgi:hypothetical protein
MSLLAARRSSDDRKNYRQRHPEPEDNDDGSAPPEGWHWYQLIPGLVLALLYYSTNTDPIPDVPFSFFLKHMVQLGLVEKLEVSSSRDKVYIYLYPDSIINGRMVRVLYMIYHWLFQWWMIIDVIAGTSLRPSVHYEYIWSGNI